MLSFCPNVALAVCARCPLLEQSVILLKSHKRFSDIFNGKMVADGTHEYMGLNGSKYMWNGPCFVL